MAYNANTNWANEEKYLNNLISQGGGNAAWAKKQMNELNAAKQQYGGQTQQPSAGTTANKYFPAAGGQGSVPNGYQSGTSVSAGTTTAPNGDVLPMHDWSTDKTDYSSQMLNAKTIQEFLSAAQKRENKANAQGIDILGGGNVRTNEDLYKEWLAKNPTYSPNYGDFVYRGWGMDSTTGKEGIIDNAGVGSGYYGMDGEGHWGYYEDPGLTKKLENGRWDDYASSDGGYVRMNERGPDMTAQDLSRAGQTVILTSPKGTWRVTYGANGYPVSSVRTSTSYTPGLIAAKADNDQGVSSSELLYQDTGHRYVGPGSNVGLADIKPATRADYEAAMTARGTGAAGENAGMGGLLPDASGVSGGNTGAGASGGSYSGGTSTGSSTGGGYDLSEWLKKQYESALEGELAGLKDAYEKNSASLDDEEARLSGIYDPQRNRVAAQNALAKRVWDERAAANGLSSGANGQAELARSSAMQRDLASIGEEEANARADISLRKQNLTIEYTNAITQAKANGQSELAKALYNELVRVQGLEREDQIRASENALKQAQAQMEYELALKQMEADSAAASQETVKPSLTASQAYTAYKNGIRTNEVMTAMQYYYGIGGSTSGTGSTGSSTGGSAKSGSAAAKSSSGNKSSSSTADAGYNASNFNAAMSSLNTMLAQGKTEYAVGGIDSFWHKLSAAQKADVQKVLKRYGLTYQEG